MTDKQREFILLRADGLSYDKIAKQLKVSKVTLIQWSKLFIDDINDVQFQAFITLKEKYTSNKLNRYEILLKQLDKIDKAILKADLSEASIKDLFSTKNHLYYQITDIEKSIQAKTHIMQTDIIGNKEELKLSLNEIS